MAKESTTINIASEYNNHLCKIYKHENIHCLSDWDDVLFDGKNALAFFINTTSKAVDKHKINKDELNKIETDLISSTSGNIKFCIGNMLFYKECGLNDFNKKKIGFNGELITQYRIKKEEQRYLLFASIGFEKLYNFWDRIGDLLNLCLNLDIKTDEVDFTKVLNKANNNIQSNYFNSLNNYKNIEYTKFNEPRRKIVHHYQLDTYFYTEWSKHKNDPSKMKELQEEKESLLDDLIKYNEDTFKGFENACKLIEEQALR